MYRNLDDFKSSLGVQIHLYICIYIYIYIYIYVCVTLDHKTSHKGQFFETEKSESWINKLSIDVWFVMIWQYLSKIQLLENLESEGAK